MLTVIWSIPFAWPLPSRYSYKYSFAARKMEFQLIIQTVRTSGESWIVSIFILFLCWNWWIILKEKQHDATFTDRHVCDKKLQTLIEKHMNEFVNTLFAGCDSASLKQASRLLFIDKKWENLVIGFVHWISLSRD